MSSRTSLARAGTSSTVPQKFWRCAPRCSWTSAGLLVQPPSRQSEFIGNNLRFLYDHAVWFEYRIDVPGRPPCVISQGHGSAAENVHVSDQAAPSRPVAESPERFSDHFPIKERVFRSHATSNSCAAT